MPGDKNTYTREQYMNMVYRWVRDSVQLNKLLDGKETDIETMALYVDMAVDWFNTDPPQTSYSLENFPSMTMLIYGSVIQLLISNGILMSRNRLNYSDGGIQVQISDKAGEYMNWVQMILNMYQQRSDKIKYETNILTGFDGIGPGASDRDWWW